MRRLLVALFALALAIACNVVFLFIAIVSDPIAGGATLQLLAGLFDAAFAPNQDWQSGASLILVASVLSHAVVAICVVPHVLSVVLAEAARLRSFLWHVLAPGILSAAMPWILRLTLRGDTTQATNQTPVENRFLALFFICAALSGAIYWAFTRRREAPTKR